MVSSVGMPVMPFASETPWLRESKLLLENISRAFPSANGTTLAIDNLSLNVKEGEFLCIVGPSGCGKSTLLNIMAGRGPPAAGGVYGHRGRVAGAWGGGAATAADGRTLCGSGCANPRPAARRAGAHLAGNQQHHRFRYAQRARGGAPGRPRAAADVPSGAHQEGVLH